MKLCCAKREEQSGVCQRQDPQWKAQKVLCSNLYLPILLPFWLLISQKARSTYFPYLGSIPAARLLLPLKFASPWPSARWSCKQWVTVTIFMIAYFIRDHIPSVFLQVTKDFSDRNLIQLMTPTLRLLGCRCSWQGSKLQMSRCWLTPQTPALYMARAQKS